MIEKIIQPRAYFKDCFIIVAMNLEKLFWFKKKSYIPCKERLKRLFNFYIFCLQKLKLQHKLQRSGFVRPYIL